MLGEVAPGARLRHAAGDAVAVQRQRERDVAVPDEDERRLGQRQRGVGGLRREHVLPYRMPRARVVQVDAVAYRAGRERLEEVA